MRIKEFEKPDLPECAEIFTSVFNGNPWNENWHLSDSTIRLEDIFHAPKFSGFVATDNQPIGFVAGNLIRIEHNDIFELKEMCVLENAQRKGVGSKLLFDLKEHLLMGAVDSIFLQTSHQTPAFKFYLKNGFYKEAHFSALAFKLK